MGDWTEKYRPKTLDEIVGNEKAVIELRRWAESWSNGKPKKRAVILSGKPGTGKTSSAIALANDFNWTSIELNTSDARNSEKIKKVATSGALNETFTDDGRFISSDQGGKKLIILDEADNLYEKISGTKTQNKTDLSDRGGKKAIINTIKITNQPIILIVNDYYGLIKGSGDILKNICKLIRFYDPYPSAIISLLKKICLDEGITIDPNVLSTIANRCKGDIRSAVNDLQTICIDKKQVDAQSLKVLGYRDREKDIFTMLREVFKTKNIQSIRESVTHLNEDPKLLLLWLNENLPKEYIDTNDLVKGYNALSKADIFLGRTQKSQNYKLWSYSCDIMNGGIAMAKTHNYPNDSYKFPTWLKMKKTIKNTSDNKESIIKKIHTDMHNSNKKTKDFLLSYFIHMFRNDTYFAIKTKNKYNLTENEIEYLLGKTHAYKLKEILLSSEIEKIKPIPEEPVEKIEKERKEKIQQNLFDF
jgi:replication factor C large subunit